MPVSSNPFSKDGFGQKKEAKMAVFLINLLSNFEISLFFFLGKSNA